MRIKPVYSLDFNLTGFSAITTSGSSIPVREMKERLKMWDGSNINLYIP